MADIETCSAPGCSEPGTNKCSSCKITLYCCVACQTVDWPLHKEECQGHLLKVGVSNIQKAMGFEAEHNWVQSLRFSELALTKMDKLKARPLEVLTIFDNAFRMKFNALGYMDKQKEALESAKKRYSMWAAGNMRNAGMLDAAFPLIEGLLHNEEYEQASLIAHTANEMIINDIDCIIPADQRQLFLAEGAKWVAQSTIGLSKSGGIPPKEKEKVGDEAIALARKALKIDTQLFGAESRQAGYDMETLANLLQHFKSEEDDESFRLQHQIIAIYGREYGSTSLNVAICEENVGKSYVKKGLGARKVNRDDVGCNDRCIANLELALPHFRESARIFRAINRGSCADKAMLQATMMEGQISMIRAIRTQLAHAAAAGTKG